MNKTELIAKVAEETELPKGKVQVVLDGIINSIGDSLKSGDKVSFVGFGTFEVAKRDARTGRNPQTGDSIKIPARKVVRFKAGKQLKDNVN
ncbi:MAG: DNA-binding protein [Acidobacteria bacterium CG_4_9_14_3_um_filter_49_7]|nr:MAG: DNA-binding protein [Acidobacteria bacterium CG_4_9_14_3_um_filter_49_7]